MIVSNLSQRPAFNRTLISLLVTSFSASVLAIDNQNKSSPVLEEILVTAEKREESLQETPISISVVSGDAIEKFKVEDIEDFVTLIPGAKFELASPSESRIQMRGMLTIDDSPSSDQSTGFFIDGIYFGNTFLLNQQIFDVERVEVLRGPQGTLWGQNVVGGSINISTREPTEEFDAGVEVSVGRYGQRDLAGFVSGPLAKNLYGRLSYSGKHSDGWLKNLETGNDLNGIDSDAFRAKLRWDISDDLVFRVSANYEGRVIDGYGPAHVGGSPNLSFLNLPDGFDSSKETLLPEDGYFDSELWGVSVGIDWNLTDNLTLYSLTGYNNYNLNSPEYSFLGIPSEAGGHTRPAINDVETISQEFRIANDPSGRLKWQAGLTYYGLEAFESESHTMNPKPGSTLDFIHSLYGISGITVTEFRDTAEVDSYAVFGQATYALNNWINLTLGGRYTYVEKNHSANLRGDASFLALEPGYTQYAEADWEAFTPKITLDANFQDIGIIDQLMLYSTYSEGWKAGGFSVGPDPLTDQTPFSPEEVDNYEAGFKSTLLDNRLNFNLAYFHAKYQLQSLIVGDTENGGVGRVETLAATMDGIESDIALQVTDWLKLTLGYTYYDGTYDKGSFLEGEPVGGNTVVQTPKDSFVFGWNMEWPAFNDSGAVFFDGSYLRSSKMYNDPTNSHFDFVGGERVHDYTKQSILNIQAGLRKDNWEVYLWGKNILDDYYILRALSIDWLYLATAPEFFSGSGAISAVSGAPRSFGISAKWSW